MSRKYQASQFSPPNGSIVDAYQPNASLIGYFAGTPTASISGYLPGAVAFDITNAIWYRNTGTVDAATWVTAVSSPIDLSTLTATAAEINGSSDLSNRTVVVPAGGGAVVLPANGGVVLIPLVTANVTCTLPATPTAGLTYKFVFVGSAADAEDWVITAAAFFAGGVVWMDEDAADAEVASIYANGTTHNTLTVNNPAAGTYVEVIGNGTNWCLNSMIVSADTPAFSAV